MDTRHDVTILTAGLSPQPWQRKRRVYTAQLAAHAARLWRSWAVDGFDCQADTCSRFECPANTSRQCEHHAGRVRSNGSAKPAAIEFDVEPPTCPTYVNEPAYDRGWDCDTHAACVALGAHGRFESKDAVDRQHRLHNSLRHS